MRRSKNMNKKKIKIMLILVLVILIILVVVLKVLEKKANTVVYSGAKEAELASEYLKGKVTPQGIHQYSINYKGNVTNNEFYEALNDTVNCFEDLSEKLETQASEDIFEESSEQIKKYLGIENIEDFEKLCELLKEKNIQNTNFSHCKIVENTFYTEGIYSKFDMVFVYEDGTELEVQLGILNKKSSKTFILTVFV